VATKSTGNFHLSMLLNNGLGGTHFESLGIWTLIHWYRNANVGGIGHDTATFHAENPASFSKFSYDRLSDCATVCADPCG
jgi:hypothetical protein